MFETPLLICIGGATGTGKTTTGYKLARSLSQHEQRFHVLDSDVVRREILGYDLKYHMQFCDYADEVTEKVSERIENQIRENIRLNESVINVSGCWASVTRNRMEEIAKELNVPFIGFWLRAPKDVLKERIQKRWGERVELEDLSIEEGHASDADITVLERHSEGTFGEVNWKVIEADQSTEELLEALIQDISNMPE